LFGKRDGDCIPKDLRAVIEKRKMRKNCKSQIELAAQKEGDGRLLTWGISEMEAIGGILRRSWCLGRFVRDLKSGGTDAFLSRELDYEWSLVREEGGAHCCIYKIDSWKGGFELMCRLRRCSENGLSCHISI
jgi:hypothetical protein